MMICIVYAAKLMYVVLDGVRLVEDDAPPVDLEEGAMYVCIYIYI